MTIFANNNPETGIGRLMDLIFDGVGSMTDRIRRRIQINRNKRLLRELPDHILRDIGVTRGDINTLATYGRIPEAPFEGTDRRAGR
jgi:uncharacterized protein YjiS (DUF1127 family)